MATYGAVIGNGLRAARDATTRELIERSGDASVIDIPVPLDALSVDAGEICNLTRGPEGWGSASATRRIVRRVGTSIDLTAKTARGRFSDLHGPARLGAFDALSAPFAANLIADGAGQILPHNGVSFFRASRAFVYSTKLQRVVLIPPHRMAIDGEGALFERAATNLLRSPSFQYDALFEWAVGGAGVNGSAISVGTWPGYAYFEPSNGSGMPLGLKMHAGSPHTSDLYFYQLTTDAVPANSWLTFSIDLSSPAVAPVYMQLIRSIDSYYFNFGTGSWQSSVVSNAIPTHEGPQRNPFPPVAIGGSDSQVYAVVVMPSGGLASREVVVHNMQLEVGQWASSRLASDNLIAARGEVDYCFDNGTSRRVWPALRSSVFLRYVPHFWTAHLTLSQRFYFFSLVYDASNEIALYYDAGTAKIVFLRRAGGANAIVQGAYTMVRDSPVDMVVRCASSSGELDYRYGPAAGGQVNFDVWAGPPGALALVGSSSGAVPAESAKCRLQIGGRSGDCAEGHMTMFELSPMVWRDEEIQRWSY